MAAYRQALQLEPQSAETHNNLGIALGSSGNLQAAVAQFKQALTIDPDSADARRNLEMAEQALNQARTRP